MRRRTITEAAAASRRIQLLTSTLVLAAASATTGPKSAKGPKGPNKRRPSFSWRAHLKRLDDRREFYSRYRLWPEAFHELADAMLPLLRPRRSQKNGKRHGGKPSTDPYVVLAVTLRYLSGGSAPDLKLIYGLAKQDAVYTCVWRGVDAINKHLKIHFPIDDLHQLRQLEADFAERSHAAPAWRGQVGCVDGVDFGMKNPGIAVENPVKYHVTRKDKHALLCIAVCDYNRRFIDYDISQTPTTHDSLAWAASPLGKRINAGDLPAPFFINGDAAFTGSESMITPSAGADDDFDFYQSSERMAIECAFGILIRRFPILWRPLEMRFDRRAAVVGACMKLHNFCITKRIEHEQREEGGMWEVQPGVWRKPPRFNKHGAPIDFLTGDTPLLSGSKGRTAPKPTPTASARKQMLMQSLQYHGLLRPRVGLVRRPISKKKRGRPCRVAA